MRKFPAVPLSSIRFNRLTSGLRLVEVALASGLSPARLGTIERRPETATAEELDLIARTLRRMAASASTEQAR